MLFFQVALDEFVSAIPIDTGIIVVLCSLETLLFIWIVVGTIYWLFFIV